MFIPSYKFKGDDGAWVNIDAVACEEVIEGPHWSDVPQVTKDSALNQLSINDGGNYLCPDTSKLQQNAYGASSLTFYVAPNSTFGEKYSDKQGYNETIESTNILPLSLQSRFEPEKPYI